MSNHDSKENSEQTIQKVIPLSKILSLEERGSAVCYDSDYRFNDFLGRGGAFTDGEVIGYLADCLFSDLSFTALLRDVFGCSALLAESSSEENLFGRNFD